MQRREATIQAKDEAAAEAQALKLLETDADNLVLVAEGSGVFQASLKNADAEIEIHIASDRMSLKITDYQHHRGGGALLSAEFIEEKLRAEGIVATPHPDAIHQILKRAARDKRLPDIVIAEGTPPTPGQDGRIELLVETAISIGSFTEDGRIDFRERGLVQTVVEGQLLGRIVPPEAGVEGRDVAGKTLAAPSGRPAFFKVGENVEFNDQTGELHAEMSGTVKYTHRVLSVSETIDISGDVDLSTGNIHTSEGSLKVRGVVRSGFTIEVAGNVIIGKSIEDATVIAGGDVEVQRGIIGGHVTARSAVFARFTQNAHIVADGDVIVENSIFNCDVDAGDRVVVVNGSGLIRGSNIRCNAGVEAVEIGSDSSKNTHIVIEAKGCLLGELIAEKDRLKETAAKYAHLLGHENPEAFIERLPTQQRAEALRATKISSRIERLCDRIDTEMQRLKELRHATVRVRGIIHPGTMISIAGTHLTIDHAITSAQFYYNREKDVLEWEPI